MTLRSSLYAPLLAELQRPWEALDGADALPFLSASERQKGKTPEARFSAITHVSKEPVLAIVTREHVGSDRQSMTWEPTWTLLSLSDSVVQSNVPAAAHCGPGLQGQHESDSPPVSCEHILAKSDDPFPSHLYIPPPLPALLFEFRPGQWCKRRRPSFLLSESDAPFVSKDRVGAHRGLWCS